MHKSHEQIHIMKYIYFLLGILAFSAVHGQGADRWQQHVNYTMDIDMDVSKHQFDGKQTIEYTNNSPDSLKKVYYHLYFNAFQPNSMMDIRSRTIVDPDRRVSTRISQLTPEEIGYHQIKSLTQDGQPTIYRVEGTILEVALAKAIMPGQTTTLQMEFHAQVPVQIRRSGRDNAEGIDYTMSQWYPKLSEYDYQGWHANPYIGREFHGVWGNFDVTIHIPEDYVVAASGEIQNPNEVGAGYAASDNGVKVTNGKKSWRFVAKNVHDFAWGADRDYKVVSKRAYNGTMMYFVYQPGQRTNENWEKLPEIMDEALKYMNGRFGKYPYPVYNFVQGGDGGMEYPMLTFITGFRQLGSLVGVSVHEWMHSWYQMVLGTNESLYAWMDEGFTSFGSTETMNHLRKLGMLGASKPSPSPFEGTYNGYLSFVESGRDEPLSTHADHFSSNRAYGVGSYTKGSIFMRQLEYIMGEEPFAKGLHRYFNTWKFKHPNPNDFIRVMEKTSGLELDWYKEYWINTTHHPDYAVYDVEGDSAGKYKVLLVNEGTMPMPLDVLVRYKDGTAELFNIPLRIMRGEKGKDNIRTFSYIPDWPWTHPVYTIEVNKEVEKVEIDPEFRMIDTNRENNTWTVGTTP